MRDIHQAWLVPEQMATTRPSNLRPMVAFGLTGKTRPRVILSSHLLLKMNHNYESSTL